MLLALEQWIEAGRQLYSKLQRHSHLNWRCPGTVTIGRSLGSACTLYLPEWIAAGESQLVAVPFELCM